MSVAMNVRPATKRQVALVIMLAAVSLLCLAIATLKVP